MPDDRPVDRNVAGLRCGQVLDKLSDYLDGALASEEKEQIERHVAGCDWCEKFGGEFAGVIASLKERLGIPPPVEEPVRRRLRDRLRSEMESSE